MLTDVIQKSKKKVFAWKYFIAWDEVESCSVEKVDGILNLSPMWSQEWHEEGPGTTIDTLNV